jgi:hypothetical protein
VKWLRGAQSRQHVAVDPDVVNQKIGLVRDIRRNTTDTGCEMYQDLRLPFIERVGHGRAVSEVEIA